SPAPRTRAPRRCCCYGANARISQPPHIAPYTASNPDDDLAEGSRELVAIGVRGCLEGECPVDDRLDAIRVDRGIQVLEVGSATYENAVQARPLEHQWMRIGIPLQTG